MKKYQIIEKGWQNGSGWLYATTIEVFESEEMTKDEAKSCLEEYIRENYSDYKAEDVDIYFSLEVDTVEEIDGCWSSEEIAGCWMSDIID